MTCINCGNATARKRYKYCSNKCQLAWQREHVKRPLFEKGELNIRNNDVLITYFLAEKQGGRFCSCCGLSEWRGEPIPLDIDHENGDNSDNDPGNLRLLCPNCHRLTETWGNSKFHRNIGP